MDMNRFMLRPLPALFLILSPVLLPAAVQEQGVTGLPFN